MIDVARQVPEAVYQKSSKLLTSLDENIRGWETFVKALDPHVPVASGSSAGERPADALTRSRQAFNCAEQLVPLLSLNTTEHCVFPLCLPHLYASSHRETYESAHLVILSIFASQTGSTTVAEVQDIGVPRPTFVEKMVSFCARCLLGNPARDKWTTAQLRIAYSALTSSASGNAPTMGQFCQSSLLSALSDLLATTDDDGAQRRHRLRLVLVSTLSALPPVMLPEALSAVSDAIRDSKGEERRELAKEVFKEIMENVAIGRRSIVCDGGRDSAMGSKGLVRWRMAGERDAPGDVISQHGCTSFREPIDAITAM